MRAVLGAPLSLPNASYTSYSTIEDATFEYDGFILGGVGEASYYVRFVNEGDVLESGAPDQQPRQGWLDGSEVHYINFGPNFRPGSVGLVYRLWKEIGGQVFENFVFANLTTHYYRWTDVEIPQDSPSDPLQYTSADQIPAAWLSNASLSISDGLVREFGMAATFIPEPNAPPQVPALSPSADPLAPSADPASPSADPDSPSTVGTPSSSPNGPVSQVPAPASGPSGSASTLTLSIYALACAMVFLVAHGGL